MLSHQNLIVSMYDDGSKNNPKEMYGLFWSLLDAIASNDTKSVYRIAVKASELNGRLPRIFDAFIGGADDGKFAVFLPFFPGLVEQSTEKKAYNSGRTTSSTTDRAFGKYDYLAKVGYIFRLIYGSQTGIVSESPNSLEFWVRCWFARHLHDLGELRGDAWAEFLAAIKSDKKRRIPEIMRDWRTLSPYGMHAVWQEEQAEKAKAQEAKAQEAKAQEAKTE